MSEEAAEERSTGTARRESGDALAEEQAKSREREQPLATQAAAEEHDGSENGDEIGASEEEALEEIMDAAVRLLQGLYRARKARRALRDLVRASFVKEYDKENDRFVYRNKLNGQVREDKPLLLGDEDLPDPKIHVAPEDFSARPACMRHFALVVTVVAFDSPKLPDLDHAYSDHHSALQDTLVHPFLSQYGEDDSIFALNPSLDVLRQHLDTLERQVSQHGGAPSSIFIYFTTHAIQVPRGLDRGTYFACADTNFQSTGLVRRSCLSSMELAQYARRLKCTDKTIVLNVAHQPKPKSTLLRSKFLYPPNSLYISVAKESSAVVLGSCRIGPTCEKQVKRKKNHRQQQQHQPHHRSQQGVGREDLAPAVTSTNDESPRVRDPESGQVIGTTEGSGAAENGGPFNGGQEPREVGQHPGPGSPASGANSATSSPSQSSKSKPKRKKKGRWFSRSTQVADSEHDSETSEGGQERGAEHVPDVPSSKGMRVIRNEDGTYTVADKWDKYREACQRAKDRVLGAPGRAYRGSVGQVGSFFSERRKRKAQQRTTKLSTFEVSEFRNGVPVFCDALTIALSGAAGDFKTNARVSARQVFRHIQASCAAMHVSQAAIMCFFKEPDLDLKTVVATLPSVHPPPLRVLLVKSTMTTLLLEWALPPYTGAKPLEYELQMRGIAKYNKVWKVVGGFATIRNRKFLVPHLTSGIEHRFRVRAKNYGGWSDFSSDSELFVPQAARTMSVEETMKSAAQRGIPNLISTMSKYRTSDEALLLGCWMLNTKALLANGFKRCSTSKDIIQVILDAMDTFPSNATLQATSLLVLGWACFGHTGAADFALRRGANEAISRAKEAFPSNAAVHGNALWASANIKQGDLQEHLPARVKKQREDQLPVVAMQHGYFR